MSRMIMAAERVNCLLSNEQLLPLLPVLYIAWVDVQLTTSERRWIRAPGAVLPAFDADSEATLDAWLDPARPPTATELARLRHRIQQLAGKRQPTLAALTASMQPGVGDDLTDAVAAYVRERQISDAGASAA